MHKPPAESCGQQLQHNNCRKMLSSWEHINSPGHYAARQQASTWHVVLSFTHPGHYFPSAAGQAEWPRLVCCHAAACSVSDA
jgi:hypothetical protein